MIRILVIGAVLCLSRLAYAITDEQRAYAFLVQGMSAYDNSQYTDAIGWYQAALDLKAANQTELYFYYAQALAANQQIEEAFTEYTRYLNLTGHLGQNHEAAALAITELRQPLELLREARQREIAAQEALEEAKRQQEARQKAEAQAQAKEREIAEVISSIDTNMVLISQGTYMMGHEPDILFKPRENEMPRHQVTIPAFRLSKFEVTQVQWKAVMNDNPSSFSSCGPNCPVENVSWLDVQTFIQRLNEKTGKHYRLPSEAEWEFAARAGSQSPYYSGDDIPTGKINCNGCRPATEPVAPTPVGTFFPNPFGLYDMNGNVWEWNQDCYTSNYENHPGDGKPQEHGDCSVRTLRGGSWLHSKSYVRSAYRNREAIDVRLNVNGFRLAENLPLVPDANQLPVEQIAMKGGEVKND